VTDTRSATSTTLLPDASGTVGRGVRRLIGPVRTHILDGEKPRSYSPLASLRCGEQGEKAVREVELTARRLRGGGLKLSQSPVILEDPDGRLVGYASVHSRPRGGYDDGFNRPWIAERYIVAFGRDVHFRGYTLRDGVTRIGEILVRAALDMVAVEMDGAPMPAVSALVRAENTSSHRIFDALSFDRQDAENTGYTQDLRWRSAGAPLPPALARDVYVPPAAPVPTPGRNDPCWCGSGAKLKRCHGS
jgi:SEC-C motif